MQNADAVRKTHAGGDTPDAHHHPGGGALDLHRATPVARHFADAAQGRTAAALAGEAHSNTIPVDTGAMPGRSVSATTAASPAGAASTTTGSAVADAAFVRLDSSTAVSQTGAGAAVKTLLETGTVAVPAASTTEAAAGGTAASANALATDFFTAGDLVISVYGDGDGSGSYGDNQAAPIVLEELTTNGGFVRQMVLSQTAQVVNGVTEYAVSGEYGSSSEGTLELSADGRSLVIAGYAINAATYNAGGAAIYGNAALAQSTSVQGGQYAAVARVIADIGADGSVDSSTALYNIDNTNNPRSVATVDGSSFFISGQGVKGDTTQGVFVAMDGASTATAIDTSTDTRAVEISDGTLYVSRDSKQNNSSSISSYGGLPDGSTTAAVLPGLSGTVTLTAAEANTVNASAVGTKINLSPENFFFANGTTLYVADSGAPKTGSGPGDGGLQKWSLVSGSWVLDYTLSSGLNLVSNKAGAGTTGLIGLTGKVVGNQVALYATNATIGDLDQTYLYGITDTLSATTNPGESFTTLMTAAADTNIRGIAFAPSSDAPCYAAGTMILTDRGERAVETLRAGDRVMVLEGNTLRSAPICWVGQRQVRIDRHPEPDRVRPIRFAPGAIADGVPSRPLFLSPDHALLLDNVLVAARLLLNGETIAIEHRDAVTYVHVELDQHGILLAENTPAESYLDTGNRGQFAGAATQALHPVFDRGCHPLACAPLATDPAIVAPIHRRLAERAGIARSSPPTTRDAALCILLPDGGMVAAHVVGADGRHSFWLTPGQAPIRVVLGSRSQSPASLHPWLDDRRRLGVAIASMQLWSLETGLDPEALEPCTQCSGWWPLGQGDAARWTDGRAELLLPKGCLRLDVVVAATTEYAVAA